MSIIHIPVTEVRKGDVLDIAGVNITVQYDYDLDYPSAVFTDCALINFPPGATITVDRPEMDAELIKAMLEAWGEADDGDTEDMRRVLAVVREHDGRADQ